ncbi:hypothetical protein FB192DRAFT_1458101 [Mucor lusitanicus]|uniref:Uncharacterized protein n=2 Tax=Mucor circinelloides f. lusitanicus TaxID=29924 RepID=A0A162TXW9_MUCCL|nr:hypothetical protein FB192DRAFT_1458101 [Mucor lusitanicus]OAD08012.1 hypothetical protein MUCCIDRAFT_104962 [Mucor lusitanicus CBS 277.49]
MYAANVFRFIMPIHLLDRPLIFNYRVYFNLRDAKYTVGGAVYPTGFFFFYIHTTMIFNKIATAAAIKSTVHRHAYSTASSSSSKSAGSFYYQYGTPLVKCIVLASATTLGFQLLWQHLEYQEYRDEADAYVTKLENRLKSLEEQQQQQQ